MQVPDYGPIEPDDGGIPKEFHPSYANLLMAAFMHTQQQQEEMRPRVPGEELQREEESAKLGAHMMAPAPAAPSSAAHSPPAPRPPSAGSVVRLVRR
jgi:hypothetical protein